ncbi:glycosyltransferase [Gelidibacter maritimus]|uniref:Glycosyltransferase n=1 Tax=Gelidibacter maritimus TaxID=2761487 RepID=A0A7W2M651_9FLAO|nr:glycosyltransferase [Gelidibacter maritimus]MBA6153394.1 glycosyltransferase [Gelidibacter maritimus]
MEAILILTHRFQRDRNGNVFTINHVESNLIWDRYLKVFTHLTVLARIQEVEEEVDERFLISQKNISFVAIPYFVGPKEFIKNYFKINKTLAKLIRRDRAYICRLPNMSGNLLIKHLRRKNIPYVVELVADPWDVYSAGSLKKSMNPFFLTFNKYRSLFTLRKSVRNAKGVIYVTEYILQKRYPAQKKAITTHASNVVLKKKSFSNKPLELSTPPNVFKICSIGSLEQLYKSPDIVLKAIKKIRDLGKNVQLTWLGGGFHKSSMIQLSKELEISEAVFFKGNVSPEVVFQELENSHLYLQASRTEGLPRAVIEAMAKGLPCIGTRIGGIPELLDEEALIDKDNIDQLVNKVIYFLDNLNALNRQAKKNLEKARTYQYEILEKRREDVYRCLILKKSDKE